MTAVQEDPIVTDKAKEAIILIAIIFVVIFLVGMILFNLLPTDGNGGKEAAFFAGKIPTVVEIQILLGVKPDGVVGPNTIAAWRLAENNQHAARYNYFYEEVE